MFQYALGRRLSLRRNTDLKFDLSWYTQNQVGTKREYQLNLFNIKENFASREEIAYLTGNYSNRIQGVLFIFRRLLRLNNITVEKKLFAYDPDVISSKNSYFIGSWQNEKYFEPIKDILIRDFSLRNKLSESLIQLENEIINSNSICLHVRRGDLISNSSARLFNGFCDITYYLQAVEKIVMDVSSPSFFIFSDDIPWCKENLEIKFPVKFVSELTKGCISDDFCLMTRCKHYIISNSTFGWWAAWLNQGARKIVIAPKRWLADPYTDYKDFIPPNWQKL
jgi:hypothetical protein